VKFDQKQIFHHVRSEGYRDRRGAAALAFRGEIDEENLILR